MTKKRRNNADSGILDRIKSVDEIELRLSCLIYGRSGTGKTTVAATFPKPILVLDFNDEGTNSVRGYGKDVKVLRIEEWSDVEEIYWYLKDQDHPYKTVVLDTVTEMVGYGITKVLEDNNKEKGGFLSKQNWGEVAGLLKLWIMNYRDLAGSGLSVVFTAQDRTERKDDEDEEVGLDDEQLMPQVGPAMMPSVAKTLVAAVQVILNTFVREQVKQKDGKMIRRPEFRARVGPHSIYLTKIRAPKGFKVPRTIKNPSYDHIIQILKGEPLNGEE